MLWEFAKLPEADIEEAGTYHVDREKMEAFLKCIQSITSQLFCEAMGLVQYVYEECFVNGKEVEDKLKLNGGDIKAVQGDSGHSRINMVTDVYFHIIDDDRRKNAELFEQAFYEKKDLDPSMRARAAGNTVELPNNVDARAPG